MATTTAATAKSSTSSLTGLRSSGLISGLDTESIVKQMSAATKNKINKQQQKLDSLTWKQNSYRTAMAKISSFKDTYFNTVKPDTNLGSNYLMAAYTSSSSNNKVTVSAGTNSIPTTYKITNINRLAKTAEVKSDFGTGKHMTGGIKLDFSALEKDKEYKFNINIDGLSKDISFVGGENQDENIANFNNAIKSAFGSDIADKFKVGSDMNLQYLNNGTDTISHTFTISASEGNAEDTLKQIGITTGQASNRISTSLKLSEINFTNELSSGSYLFSINGVDFTFNGDSSIKDIVSKVNSSKANVTMTFNSLSQTFSIKSKDEGNASTVKMSQKSGNLLTSMFGENVINAGNSQSTVSFKSSELSGTSLTVGNADPVKSTDFTDVANNSIEVTVNGVTKSIGLWKYDSNGLKYDYATTSIDGKTIINAGANKAVSSLNEQLSREFGADAPSFKYDSKTGEISLVAGTAGDTVSVSAIKDNAGSTALMSKLGFKSGTTNAITSKDKLSALMGDSFKEGTISFGDKQVTITKETTFADLEAELGDDISINYDNGIMTTSKQISADDEDSKVLISNLFGGKYDVVANYSGTKTNEDGSMFAKSIEYSANGQNAIITINGTTITNASNSVTIDGTTINLGSLSDSEAAAVNDSDKAITISTSRDTSKAQDAVTKFVDDYNKLIEGLNTEISTNRPTSDGSKTGTKYDPLTEEQKAEMTDTQIQQWEEKAKTGLLYMDTDISNFLTKLRSAMNTRTSEGFSLYDMGITVSTTYSDKGKLIISDPAKLKNAFENNADQIQKLFTDTNNGLSANVSKVIDSAVSTKRDSYGSLTQLAGVANTATQAENAISKKVQEYSTYISSLKTKYANEQERYWKQFTNLETMMNKYNNQASLFSQATGN